MRKFTRSCLAAALAAVVCAPALGDYIGNFVWDDKDADGIQDSGEAGALPHLHVFDSAALTSLVPAVPGSSGASHDWINEIHLTPAGYAKLGRPFGAFIEAVLARYP